MALIVSHYTISIFRANVCLSLFVSRFVSRVSWGEGAKVRPTRSPAVVPGHRDRGLVSMI